jgi:hypothetical protein
MQTASPTSEPLFDQMVDLLVAMLQKLDAPAVQQLRDFAPEP